LQQNSPKTLVILGATSAVAIAYARHCIEKDGAIRFILAGRDETKTKTVLADLVGRGADETSSVVIGDLGSPDEVERLAGEILASAPAPDEMLLAYGLLGEQKALQASLPETAKLLETNFVSAAMWAEVFAQCFVEKGAGHIVIIGSVAGDRGRQSNYLYGATKGALERVAEGIAHRFAGSKYINVTLVKPGFIDTPMTDHIEGKGGPLWASPEKIAQVTYKAVRKRRVRVYAPWIWRYILLIVRALPVPVMHRTKM